VAKAVRDWLARLGVQTLFIQPGSPLENGYIESFNGKLRDELLNGEVFSSVQEAKLLTDAWRQHYNHHRPHSALAYRPPAPVVIKPKFAAWSESTSSSKTGAVSKRFRSYLAEAC
jgi:transposase InsO family protein